MGLCTCQQCGNVSQTHGADSCCNGTKCREEQACWSPAQCLNGSLSWRHRCKFLSPVSSSCDTAQLSQVAVDGVSWIDPACWQRTAGPGF